MMKNPCSVAYIISKGRQDSKGRFTVVLLFPPDYALEERRFVMNVYDYMNSEAIARHCQELNYSFTPLQTAWLINRSRRHTLKEKHRAYGWVMEHMPDEEVDLNLEEAAGGRAVSLRWFLKEYMRLEGACPENCFQPDFDWEGLCLAGIAKQEESPC